VGVIFPRACCFTLHLLLIRHVISSYPLTILLFRLSKCGRINPVTKPTLGDKKLLPVWLSSISIRSRYALYVPYHDFFLCRSPFLSFGPNTTLYQVFRRWQSHRRTQTEITCEFVDFKKDSNGSKSFSRAYKSKKQGILLDLHLDLLFSLSNEKFTLSASHIESFDEEDGDDEYLPISIKDLVVCMTTTEGWTRILRDETLKLVSDYFKITPKLSSTDTRLLSLASYG